MAKLPGRWSGYRNLLLIGIFAVLAVLGPYINFSWYYSSCGPFPSVSVDYNFKETHSDVLSDIDYARTHPLPPVSPEDTSESQRKQRQQYQKQAVVRRRILLDRPTLAQVQEIYIPQVNCPTLVRLGSTDSSGYVLCNPWLIPTSNHQCIMYSLGVGGSVLFEQDFYEKTNQKCHIYCLDMNEKPDALFEPFRGTFMRAAIHYKTESSKDQYSLLDIMHKFGHTKLDVLKVDIQGAEFSILPVFLRQYNDTICQIIVELHVNSNSEGYLYVRLFQMLERRGYLLSYREVLPSIATAYLNSYVHVSCLERLRLSASSVLFTYFI